MCGIAGMVGLPYNDNIIRSMEQTMARRGPDSKGRFTRGECVLLHSRLAIVDPEGGVQPMELCCAGECYTIVYNGELYNTEEIKSELLHLGHSFRTYSDTEVVLHAYAQWKQNCLDKFNGIFGFAIWEHTAKRLFIARDRMGVKPVFYSLKNNGIIFASEMKTLLAHPEIPAKLNAEGAAQLILLGPGRIPGSGVFCDIEELRPGFYMFFQNGKMIKERYWRLRDREHSDSFEETAEKVRYLLTDAIRRQMVSDVPMGTFLSGGLDSSIISAVCARELGKPLDTFSLDYENNDLYFTPGKFQPESDNVYIEIMRDTLGSVHHWTVLDARELSDTLEEATIARDLPGMGDVDFSLLAFSKRIKKFVKMALSGECADEIFGGYPWYRDPEIRTKEGFPWAQNTAFRSSFMSPSLKHKISGEDFVMDHYRNTIQDCDILPGSVESERRMKEMVNLNMYWFMQTLLDRKDRMTMYCGLEVRVPFCDYRIAEYLYSVPWEFKDYRGREKGLLRYAMSEYLPQSVLYRKKSPYPKTWDPAYGKLMQEKLNTLLDQKDAAIYQLVDKEALRGLLGSEDKTPWYGQLMRTPQTIAYMLQIDFWLRHYNVEITDIE